MYFWSVTVDYCFLFLEVLYIKHTWKMNWALLLKSGLKWWAKYGSMRSGRILEVRQGALPFSGSYQCRKTKSLVRRTNANVRAKCLYLHHVLVSSSFWSIFSFAQADLCWNHPFPISCLRSASFLLALFIFSCHFKFVFKQISGATKTAPVFKAVWTIFPDNLSND